MNCPNFIMTVLSVFIKDKISTKVRILASLISIFALGLTMPFIAQFIAGDENHRGTADIMISLIIIVIGVFSAFLQGGVFGYSAMFPPVMMGAVMFGQGASGVVCIFIRVIFVIALPSKPGSSNDFIGCIIYFAIASAILLVCVFLYYVNEKTDYAKYYI